MLDNPGQVERLLTKMRASLPLTAILRDDLVSCLRKENGAFELPSSCPIARVDYAGDEGGIMCQLEPPGAKDALFVSITHLAFDRRTPHAREIAAYQKHRNKRLRQLRARVPAEALDAFS